MTTEALHIFEILVQHPDGITRDEVNRQLIEDGAEPVERKPFAKAIEMIRKEARVTVEATRIGGLEFSYRVPEPRNSLSRTASVLAANIEENKFLEECRFLGNRIQPVVILRGREFLRPIGKAMRKNCLMRCRYQKFSDVEPYDCLLAPYILKAYEGRWYLFALKWNSMDEVDEHPMGTRGLGLQAFALDRMLSAEQTAVPFELYDGFSASKYFKPYFGVFCDMEPKPVKIIIRAGENDAHYIRTLPLHYTQKEKKPGVFTLEMCVTKDFELYMRRYENTTWEVEEEKSEE